MSAYQDGRFDQGRFPDGIDYIGGTPEGRMIKGGRRGAPYGGVYPVVAQPQPIQPLPPTSGGYYPPQWVPQPAQAVQPAPQIDPTTGLPVGTTPTIDPTTGLPVGTTAPTTGLDLSSLLSGSIFGIPTLYILLGVGAYFLFFKKGR